MNTRRGFTLVELMIALVIIGILATLALPRYGDAKRRAQAAVIVEDIRIIEEAVMGVLAETSLPAGLRTSAGVLPDFLAPQLPRGFQFARPGVRYLWLAPAVVPTATTRWAGVVLLFNDPKLATSFYGMWTQPGASRIGPRNVGVHFIGAR